MAILLTILKIIGIVLLCILGLVLLLLLMVLFVPLRYKVKASYKDDIYACVKASYLLHIVSFTLKYTDKLDMKLRILGIPIRLKKKATKSSEDEETKDKAEDENPEESDREAEEKPKKTLKENLATAKEYLDILSEDSTKAAFNTCKKRLGRMLKHLIPKKMDIVVKYGLKDPYITSVIMTVYDVFYVYLGKVITLYPIYYDETIDIKANIKGHIRPAPLLWQAVLVVLDSNCRRFYKKIRRKK